MELGFGEEDIECLTHFAENAFISQDILLSFCSREIFKMS
jgi:hypothetical protein